MHPKTEKLWYVELAVVVDIVMQIIISSHLTILPRYWFAGLVAARAINILG